MIFDQDDARELADQLGVNISTVWRVRNRKVWAWT